MADRGYYHNCPVVDDYLPIDADGRPRFAMRKHGIRRPGRRPLEPAS